VKRYIDEPGREAVVRLLGDGLLATARLTQIEIASALARRCRERSLSSSDRETILAALDRDLEVFALVEMTASVVHRGCALLKRHALRAADAVQLASCLDLGGRLRLMPTFVACDERLLAAARSEGLPTAP
jgi:predicted nucleic acid-binding protein